MATSNSYNFTVTAESLVIDALLEIGVIRDNETPSVSLPIFTNALRVLNMLIKARSNDRIFRWIYKRGFLLPTTDVQSVATNSHVVKFYDSTTLAATTALGSGAITLTDEGTIAQGDEIGIEQDDGTMHWTTVSVITGAAVTLTDVLTVEATSGNRVFAYTASADRITRPLEIMQANSLDVSSDSQTPVNLLTRDEYFSLQNRQTTGSYPTHLFYDAQLGTTETAEPTLSTWAGNIFFWPLFSNGDRIVEFTYRRPIQDLDSSTDVPEFPQEYYLAIVKELAANLCGRYGIGNDVRMQLLNEAKLYRDLADTPEGSLKIQPDLRSE